MTKLGKKEPAKQQLKICLSIMTSGLNPRRVGRNPYDEKITAIQAVKRSIEEMENLIAMHKSL
jgi:hypothetical protein